MDAFDQLRTIAAEKRDAAIKVARSDYARSLAQIEELKRSLGLAPPKPTTRPGQPLAAMICDLIPHDRTFTVAEIIDQLREAEPLRNFPLPTVSTCFQKIKDQGMIRRVARGDNGAAQWAVAGLEVADDPFGASPLSDVAAAILDELGPLTAAELVVAMQQRGYRADSAPRRILNSLNCALNRNPHRFRQDTGGRWMMA